MSDALLAHFQETKYEFVIKDHYYPEILDNFKKKHARTHPIGAPSSYSFNSMTLPTNPTICEVELTACRELADSLNKYYDYTITFDSITFSKKENVTFSKVELSSAIHAFFKLPSPENSSKKHRRNKK